MSIQKLSYTPRGPCIANFGRCTGSRLSIRCSVAHRDSSPAPWDDAAAMSVLAARLQALRESEERAQATARLVQALISTRPILPDNVTNYNYELEMDHKLICEPN